MLVFTCVFVLTATGGFDSPFVSLHVCVCLDGGRSSRQSVRKSSRVFVLTATGGVDSPCVSLHVCVCLDGDRWSRQSMC